MIDSTSQASSVTSDLARTSELKKASWIGIIGNTILSLVKIVAGLLAGSFAVIADGLDSLSDVLTFFITLFTARIISRPSDHRFPYGYKKAETLATKVLSFIIFFAGAQLLIATVSRILNGEQREMPQILAIYVTLFSIGGKALLSYWQYKIGRKTKSSMILASARNMRNDILISLSVLAGLVFTFVLNMPVLDSVTALIVSFWIIKVAFDIFRQTSLELMDGVEDTSVYNTIFEVVRGMQGIYNPHRVRVRKLADLMLIAMDVEVDKNLTIQEAHDLVKELEVRLKLRFDNLYDVLIHIEPMGDIENNENFGVSEASYRPGDGSSG